MIFVLFLKGEINGRPNPLKEIVLDYELSTGRMLKGEYVYLTDGRERREVWQYDLVQPDFNASVLAGSAVDKVLRGGKPDGGFAGYQVKDLRARP